MTYKASMCRIFCLSLFFLMILGNGMVFAEADRLMDITLVENVEVTSEEILLGDLVLIQGNQKEEIDKIKQIFIGKSPLPGKSRRIDRHYIVLRLKQNDIELDHIRFAGAVEVEVARGFNQITKEEIEKIVATELPELIGSDNENIKIKDIQAASGLILPKGKYSYSIAMPKNTNYLGKLLLSVYFTVGSEFKKRVYVSANIDQYANVVVVRWPLRRNYIIKDGDVEVKKMNLGDLPSNSITDIKEVLNNKLKRNVDKGTVLRADMIDIPPLIGKKDVVRMVAESERIKIVTLGESQEIGHKGDLIKVINLESNNEVYARVIDSNSVKVEF